MTPHGEPRPQSLSVHEGKIVAIEAVGRTDARRVIDADGLVALPGVIDSHVHIGFAASGEEFDRDTEAAARAGVTTAMIYYRDLEPYDALLPEFLGRGIHESHIDFGVHLGILTDRHLADLRTYVDRFRIKSIKMYLTYKHGELRQFGVVGEDDGFICDVFRAAREVTDLLVHVHCENDDIAERGVRMWRNPDDPEVKQWDDSRPILAEVEAIRRMGLFAREFGNRLFIPHLSSARGLEAALAERHAGARIWMETAPQYLWSELLRDAGPLAKVNPPVRWSSESELLWKAVRDGDIAAIGTDHAGRSRKDKIGDLATAGPGFPGMGTLLPALLAGVQQGRLRLSDIAAVQQRTATLFDLSSKGELSVGYDADVVLLDPEATKVVDSDDIGGVSDFTPFEGLVLGAPPITTILRGNVLVEGGATVAGDRVGRYVRPYSETRTGVNGGGCTNE